MAEDGISTYLRILKLNQIPIVHDHFVPLVLALLEQFRQREPLPGHLVPVVRVHELVVVHAVGRVPLDALDGRVAAVQRDDVVEQGLASGRERDRFRGVRRVVV